MGELHERGEKIDRITVANELMKFNELEACDGLSYLVSLDDGLPQIPNLDSYIRHRQGQGRAAPHHLRVAAHDEPLPAGRRKPDEILAGAEETLLKLGEARSRPGC